MTRFYSATPFSNDKFFPNIETLNIAIRQLPGSKILDNQSKNEFGELLKPRTNAFFIEYNKAKSSHKNSKARDIFIQYNHFYYTLKRCFEEPARVETFIYQYQNPRYYEPVGCKDYISPSNVAKGVAGTFIGLGIFAFAGGAVAIPFCLPLALPLMAAGLIAVLAASFYLMGSTRLNPAHLQKQEEDIFLKAAGIVEEQENEKKQSLLRA